MVEGFELDDLEPLAPRGAVGLLVPAAGPRASERAAEAALVRGKVRNSLRGGLPGGPPLITFVRRAAAPARGPAIVLSLPRGGEQPHNRRYPIAVLGPGYRGLLTSSSTRIPGIVSIVDIAPTALGAEGALESQPATDGVPRLRDLDRRIAENTSNHALAALVAWTLVAALSFLLPRAAVLAFPCVLAANLALGAAGVSAEWLVVGVLGLAVVSAAPLLALAIRSPAGVALVCVAVLAAYLAAFAHDGGWIALSPLGPTQNARFYGLSNLLETFLLVPAFAAAALVARWHWSLFAAVAVPALVLVAGSRFGADGGGAVVLGVGYATLAAALARSRRRVLAGAAAAAVLLVGLLFALDEVTGASNHVTRTLRGGPDDLAAAFRDRVTLSWERATDRASTGIIVVLGVVALVLFVGRLLRIQLDLRRTALPLSLAAAIAASLVVNDSPSDVVMTGLVAYVALEAYALYEPRLTDSRVARERPPGAGSPGEAL